MSNWLLPASIASLISMATLTAAYWYMYTQERRQYLRIWTYAWLLYTLRFVFLLLILLGHRSTFALLGNQLAAFASGVILVWGTCVFLDRRVGAVWKALAAAGGLWIIASVLYGFEFIALTLPTFLFLGYIMIWMGVVLMRAHALDPLLRRVVGATFILWGLHKIDYPFLRPVEWFAPWGYMLSTVFSLIVAIGTILIYFKHAKDQLRESRESLKTLVEFTDAIHWELDFASRKFTYVSPQIEKLLGFAPERWADLDGWSETVHPDDRERAISYCMSMSLEGRDHAFESRVIDSQGQEVWLYDIIKVISQGGRPVKLVGVMFDITRQKRYELDLRRLNDELSFFRLALDNVSDEVCLINESSGIEYANDAACAALGYSREELLKLRIEDIDPLYGAPAWEPFWNALRQQQSIRLETIHRTSQGRDYPVEVLANMVKHSGRELNLAFARDITARKESDRLLKEREYWLTASQKAARVGTYNYNIKNGSWISTEVMDDIFGIRADYEKTTQGWVALISPEHRDMMIQYLGEIIRDRRPFDMEYKIVRMSDGAERWVHGMGELLFNRRDEPSNLIGTIQDITANKEASLRLLASLEEKEVLLREVHHRVKNNMAIISSLLSMQAGKIDDPVYTEMFRESRNRIRSMALVHEKLYQSEDFARINVGEYIQSLVDNISSSYGKSTPVQTSVSADRIFLDIDTLVPCGLIINELVSNAFKHAFDGSLLPELRITLTRKNDGMIELCVADNGKGLPQGYTPETSPGLGMKLVNALARQIEGKLEFKREGGGTAFVVLFKDKRNFEQEDNAI